MTNGCYEKLKLFKKKFPGCVTWFRLKKHCAIVDQHLNPNEEVQYILAGQLDNDHLSFFNTGIVAITNERLIVAQNRLLVGYKFKSITPDLYNDMHVDCGLIWGTLSIDTVKECVYVSNLSKKCLPEVETNVTMFLQEAKKQYGKKSES